MADDKNLTQLDEASSFASTALLYGVVNPDSAPADRKITLSNFSRSILAATTALSGAMSATDKTKLDGIEEGAEVNVVDSVNGATGAVVLDPDDLDDTSTTNKFTTAEDISKLAGIAEGAEVNTVDSVNGATGTVVLDADDIDDATTTNKFTTATDISKLAGIEENADVTDAGNVDAAGATMNSDTDVSGNSWVLDEDDFASDSATKVPTQQSVRAYAEKRSTRSATINASGTAVDFEDIAVGARRITLSVLSLSTSGTSPVIVQIGSGGVPLTTGYSSDGIAIAGSGNTAQSSTAGFILPSASASNSQRGFVELVRSTAGGNWTYSGVLRLASNVLTVSSGLVFSVGDVDILRVTTEGGTDTFDAGTLTIIVEY